MLDILVFCKDGSFWHLFVTLVLVFIIFDNLKRMESLFIQTIAMDEYVPNNPSRKLHRSAV